MELAKHFVYLVMILQLLFHFNTNHLATAQSLGKCSEVQSIDNYSKSTLHDCGDKYFQVEIDLMYVRLRDIAWLRVELICDEGHTIVLENYYQLQSRIEVLRFSVDSVDSKNCRLATCYQTTYDESFILTATSKCIVALDESSNTKQSSNQPTSITQHVSSTWTNELTTSSLFSDLISSTTSSVSKHSTPSDQSIYSSNTLADFISSSGYELITGHTTYIAESISHTTESIYSSNRPLVPLASSSGYELITGHTTYTIESISHTTESIYSSNRPLVPLALSSGYEQTTNTATQSSTAHQDSVTSTTITNSNLATETAEMPSTQTLWILIITVLSILGAAVTITLTVVILLLKATKHCTYARDVNKDYFLEEKVSDDKDFPTLTLSPSLVTIVSPLDTTIPHNTPNNRISLMKELAAIKTANNVSEELTALNCQANENTAATGVYCTRHNAQLSKTSIVYTDRTKSTNVDIILTILPDNTTFLDSNGSSSSYDRLTNLHSYDSVENDYV